MKKKKFKADLMSGHKDYAVEVPFDPAREWNLQSQPLWRGRRGFPVHGQINGVSFESAIVPRQKKFYLLIDKESQRAARVSEGDVLSIEVRPRA